MEVDVGVGIVSSIRANMYRYTDKNGNTDETERDREIVLEFKRKVLYEFHDMDYEEIKAFSSKWLAKYPNQ